jgi:ABC-type lipoprotein export system ATPase subunit
MENILLPLRYSGGNRKAARIRAEAFLEEVGLAKRAHHRPTQMSGGEQQRVAIARSLINEPTLVLGDEPMGEVDTDTANALLSFMRRINAERGVSFVIVTHDLDLAARTDRVIRLRDGHVVSDERPSAQVAPRPTLAVPQAAA